MSTNSNPPRSCGPFVSYTAPDHTFVELLIRDQDKSSMARVTLPAKEMSHCVKHKTITELWYCMKGDGKIAISANAGSVEFINLSPGESFVIHSGEPFQILNVSKWESMKFIIVGIPGWPGDDEAVACPDLF